VLSGRGLYDGPITRAGGPTECDASECDREASTMRRPWPTEGCRAVVSGKGLCDVPITRAGGLTEYVSECDQMQQ